MHVLVQIGFVSLGSMLGGLLRWGVGLAFGHFVGTGFPWGTFIINISGSFFLGWFATVLGERFSESGPSWISKSNLQLLVAVGFTGAYTTFSTFEYETNTLLEDRESLKGLLYLFGSVFVGLVAVRLGVVLGRLR